METSGEPLQPAVSDSVLERCRQVAREALAELCGVEGEREYWQGEPARRAHSGAAAEPFRPIEQIKE